MFYFGWGHPIEHNISPTPIANEPLVLLSLYCSCFKGCGGKARLSKPENRSSTICLFRRGFTKINKLIPYPDGLSATAQEILTCYITYVYLTIFITPRFSIRSYWGSNIILFLEFNSFIRRSICYAPTSPWGFDFLSYSFSQPVHWIIILYGGDTATV